MKKTIPKAEPPKKPITTREAVRDAIFAAWEKMIEPLVDWEDARHRKRVRHP